MSRDCRSDADAGGDVARNGTVDDSSMRACTTVCDISVPSTTATRQTMFQPVAAPSASSSRQRVEHALRALGMPADIVEFGTSTRTSAEAAVAIGCAVAQIAKSVVFRGKTTDRCVVVVASGADRIDEKKLRAELGEKVTRADAAFVRERTGFAIGGVAPVGHIGEVSVLVDRALWSLDPIWAAAGTPNAVFRLSADDLHRIPGIRVVDVRDNPR